MHVTRIEDQEGSSDQPEESDVPDSLQGKQENHDSAGYSV